MREIICKAIANRLMLRLYYGGGFRTVEPYVYGTSSAGNEVLSAFQTQGHSQSGAAKGWKMFIVDEISQLSVSPEHFLQDQPDYNPQDPGVEFIFCQI